MSSVSLSTVLDGTLHTSQSHAVCASYKQRREGLLGVPPFATEPLPRTRVSLLPASPARDAACSWTRRRRAAARTMVRSRRSATCFAGPPARGPGGPWPRSFVPTRQGGCPRPVAARPAGRGRMAQFRTRWRCQTLALAATLLTPRSPQATYLLFEAASGYAVFEALDTDLIASAEPRVQESIKCALLSRRGSPSDTARASDLARFGKAVKLAGFRPFTSAADALEQCNAVSEGVLTDELAAFLEQCLPSKKSKYMLGVSDAKLGAAILERSAIRCECNDRVLESLRGVRLHYERLVAGLKEGDAGRAALGLAHAYSRGKVKFNVNRSDNMIIQSIATLDTLDKDINTLVMRVREWYAWHFPELSKVVADNYQYARAALAVQDKSQLTEADLPALAEALGGDEDKAMEVLVAARASMGQDISPVDLQHIEALAKRVVELAEFRQGLGGYLNDKMTLVAPNLGALIGDTVGARLIAHAGSLTNLAKYPASTVQILGAEKALFRALKTKGNTPKYGLIYHSTFIGRAQVRARPCMRPAACAPQLLARRASWDASNL